MIGVQTRSRYRKVQDSPTMRPVKASRGMGFFCCRRKKNTLNPCLVTAP